MSAPRPMLATKTDHLPVGEEWTHEVKWDGVRVLAEVLDGRTRLWSRNGNDVTTAWPDVADDRDRPRDLLVDGEVIALNERGLPDFRVLQDRMHVRDARKAARLADRLPATYMVFDVLRLDGEDLTGLPLVERRERLADLELGGWQVPAAYDDAVAAFDWVHEHAEEIGADTSRIGVAGDSAGGNLAAGVALVARERCAFQLLIYPVVDMEGRAPSRTMFNEGFYLTQSFLDVAESSYIRTGTDKRDPRLSPIYAEVPDGVAPAFVVTAGFDPLRDEGEAYARKLEEAGVKVELRRFPDQIHGFFNVIGAGRSAKGAVDELAAALKAGL